MSTVKLETKRSVTDYLDSLAWDGVPRLDRWLVDCAGAEDAPHVQVAGRLLLVAAVRRARVPGCRFDQLPILSGPQGSGKSRALRMIAVEDAWFSDASLVLGGGRAIAAADGRAIVEATEGRWLVEVSELGQLLREESGAGALKAFLAQTHDAVRRPYERQTSRVPRRFVVVGTTHESVVASDDPGARRLLSVSIQHFDLERLAAIRDQLWAEAAAAEAAGQMIHLPGVAA